LHCSNMVQVSGYLWQLVTAVHGEGKWADSF
jgi:hypothetical protein